MKEISLNAFFNKPKHDFDKIPPLIKINRQSDPQSFKNQDNSVATPSLIKLTDSSVIQQSTIFATLEDSPILITENSTERHWEEKPQTFEISIQEEEDEQQEIEESINLPIEASWMKDKNSFEILTDIFTKNTKMGLYLKYLQELLINNKNNPKMKRSFDLLSCLLVKLNSHYEKQDTAKPSFSTYQSENRVDLSPPFHSEEKQNEIHKLKQAIEHKNQMIFQIRDQYDRIIQNYAQTIFNMNNKKQEPAENKKSRRQERLTFSNEKLGSSVPFFQQSKIELNQEQ